MSIKSSLARRQKMLADAFYICAPTFKRKHIQFRGKHEYTYSQTNSNRKY